MKAVMSVQEARKILSADAKRMSDQEISQIIEMLHSLAKAAVEDAKVKLRMKKDAGELASLIYDIYKRKDK